VACRSKCLAFYKMLQAGNKTHNKHWSGLVESEQQRLLTPLLA
jgi:hypothetical protein